MIFHWPLFLWALLLPLLAALLEWRRRSGGGTAYPKILRAEASGSRFSLISGSNAGPSASDPRIRWRLWLGLAFVIVALARPQWGHIDEPVFDQSREILLALDLSRSMLATDVKPTRLEKAKLLLSSLLERVAGERVGLVVFAGTAFLQCPLSSDYEILREFLPPLTPSYLPEGGTNYEALLKTSLEAFGNSSGADRFLVVLSDGEALSDDWKPLVAQLKERNIRVIGLGVGTAEGAMVPDETGGLIKDERGAVVLSKLESGTLQTLASETRGVYTDASGWIDLAQLIQSTVDTGQEGTFREERHIRLAERFQWVLAPAMLLFLGSLWREFPVRPRPREIHGSFPGNPATAVDPQFEKPSPASTVASLLIPLTGLWFFAAGFSVVSPARGEETDATAQPLSQLVAQLSNRERVNARDYAELARTTVTYGQRQKSAQKPPVESAIRDALDGVSRGEALDPKAADWPALRTDLEKLLQKDPPPPEQEKPQPKPDQQQNQKNKDEKNEKNKNENEKKSDPSQSKENDQQKSSQSPSSPTQQEKAKTEPGQNNEPPPSTDKQAAFKDLKNDPKKPSSPSAPQPLQKVGGNPDKKPESTPTDPAMVVPLQQLEQVRQGDSPVKLQQLIRGEKPPAKTAKDW
jgi:Ca-activated chloride channel family protein